MTPREGDDMTRLPFLRTWFRTRSAIVLHLSNGTLQVSNNLFIAVNYDSYNLKLDIMHGPELTW